MSQARFTKSKRLTVHLNKIVHDVIHGLQTTARGQNQPAKPFFGPRRRFVNIEKILYLRKTSWFGGLQHIPKQSQYVRCPALGLLCNSLCGPRPRTTKFGNPWSNLMKQIIFCMNDTACYLMYMLSIPLGPVP